MTTDDSSSLRTPLDAILGARANVKILRVLVRARESLGRAEAARRAGLSPQGGRKALDRLTEVGVVRCIGTGPAPQVRLRRRHPLAPALTELFEAEADRYRDLIDGLKAVLDQTAPAPKAAWIQGPVAEGGDEYGDPLVLGVLAPAGEVDRLAERLRERLVDLERRHDVTIEVRPYTDADLDALQPDAEDTITLWGPDVGTYVGGTGGELSVRDHEAHDRRARIRAERVADLLGSSPGLRDRALDWVEKQLERGEENRELREWMRVLRSASIPRLRAVLTADTERARRLRQSLPFWPVLSEEQREKVAAGRGDDS